VNASASLCYNGLYPLCQKVSLGCGSSHVGVGCVTRVPGSQSAPGGGRVHSRSAPRTAAEGVTQVWAAWAATSSGAAPDDG
jgi:hypothetical protein